MTFQPGSAAASRLSAWQAKQVYVLAAVCLVLGLTARYFLRGSQPLTAPTLENHKGGQMTTLEQMNDVAEKRAAPLLQKLETKPNDGSLLIQLGDVYKENHRPNTTTDH